MHKSFRVKLELATEVEGANLLAQDISSIDKLVESRHGDGQVLDESIDQNIDQFTGAVSDHYFVFS
jgi:hypothetical protein